MTVSRLASLFAAKECQCAGRAAERVWTFWRKEKPLAPHGNRNRKKKKEWKGIKREEMKETRKDEGG